MIKMDLISNNSQTFKRNIRTNRISFNARWSIFKVNATNLDSYPRKRLGKLVQKIKKKDEIEVSKLCDDFNFETNEYYFDRDPYIFNQILNFYQTGKLHIGHSDCVYFVRDELEYWQIDEFLVENCCKIIYYEKTGEIEESIANEDKIRKMLNEKDDFGTRFYPKLREKLWNLFDNPNSSIYAKILFYFSILTILISVIDIGIVHLNI